MLMPPIQIEVPDDEYWRRQVKCQYACPVNTDARGYVRAIAQGDFETAYLIARGPNPLASICGRVCGAPCEAACRRGDIDAAVSIRALKRFVTGRFGPESFTKETLKPIKLLQRVLDHGTQCACSDTEELRALGVARAGLARAEARGSEADGPKVAIIGSGPAGLAAAHDLALLGYHPTVFEMEPIPAGMLAVGIPEYRLPRELIQAEVEVIRSLGVEFRCNTQVGKDITLAQIREDHRATIIAVGAKRSRVIPIPGGEGPGVLGGVEFLRDVALASRSLDSTTPARSTTLACSTTPACSTLTQLGGRVVVIGGGNVAYDVSRTVIRQIGYDVSRSALRETKVGEVHLCCLESLEEMPADDIEILEGHEEGVILHASLGPVEILRDQTGKVSGATFKRCLRVFDEAGRFAPQFDENDTTTIPADTIVWAIGQQADLSFVEPNGAREREADVKLNDRGLIDCNRDTLQTGAADVFLAGDIAYGPRLLIDAIASGKKCARSVHAYLSDKPLRSVYEFVHLNLPDYARERDYEKLEREPIPTLLNRRASGVAERSGTRARVGTRTSEQSRATETNTWACVERGYDRDSAVREASRCLDCGVNTIFDSEKCILCGGCADVCPELCLQLVSGDRLVGEANLPDLMRERFGHVDWGHASVLSEVSAIVKDEEKCIRCALCAERCPVGAITMERFEFTGRWALTPEPQA